MEVNNPLQSQSKSSDTKLHPLGVVCHSFSPDRTSFIRLYIINKYFPSCSSFH